MKNIFFLLAIFFGLLQNTLGQQSKIHAILVIDREDKEIGCEIDEANIKKMLGKSGLEANMQTVFYTPKNTLSDVISQIQALKVGGDDAIFFYYSGHGYRYQNQTGKYPFMALKDVPLKATANREFVIKSKKNTSPPPPTTELKALSIEQVSKDLRSKGARICMVMGDLCNSSIPENEPSPVAASVTTVNNYERLFKKSKGYFIVCSSKSGQPSVGMSKYGGLFTVMFLESYKELVKKSGKTDWKEIFQDSYDKTYNDLRGRRQEPLIEEINVSYAD